MGKNKRIKSQRTKGKLDPIPHNNRSRTKGRAAYSQLIIGASKNDPDGPKVRTIHHVKLSPYEQKRINLIKTAIKAGDDSILKGLNLRERKYYEMLLMEKELAENKELINTEEQNGQQ